MTTQQVTDAMESLNVQDENSSGDECDCDCGDEESDTEDDWEETIKKARIFLKTYKFPNGVCAHCYWVSYKETLPMVWPRSNLAIDPEFLKECIIAYEKTHAIFKECRSQHGARFCVDHFCAVLKIYDDLSKKFASLTWALPKHVHRMYSDSYMSWLRCNVYEDHRMPF